MIAWMLVPITGTRITLNDIILLVGLGIFFVFLLNYFREK
jgi:hypothetical protein